MPAKARGGNPGTPGRGRAWRQGKKGAMSREDKQKAWSLMDVNKDGHLNYLEFCAAFKVPRSVPSPLPPALNMHT